MSEEEKLALAEQLDAIMTALDGLADNDVIDMAQYDAMALAVTALNEALMGDKGAVFENNTFEVSTLEELKAAVAEIQEASGDKYTISIQADLAGVGSMSFKGAKDVTIFGYGHTLSGVGTIQVTDGATVNLGDSTGNVLVISGITNNDAPGMVYVTNATVNMYDGVTLKDHKGNNYFGGGVTVQGGTFYMHGGTIDNCGVSGGSVCYGGGVALDASYEEIASSGFGYLKSNVTINGGTISSNTASDGAGIFASAYFYTYADGICTSTPGIGASSNPGLYIAGGTISGNTADGMGGGVLVALLRSSLGNEIHNALINGNKADSGAGVCIFGNWSQSDIDGCNITGNTAESNGGGIAVVGNSTSNGTTLKNSTITGNTSGDRGAGVYYDQSSKLTISGKLTIQENTFNGSQNNLNILSHSYPVYIDGDLSGSQIGLSDPTLWDDSLADGDAAAVSEIFLTSGYQTRNGEHVPYECFTSDHETWVPYYGDKTEATYKDGWKAVDWNTTSVKYNNVVRGSGFTYQNLRYDPASKTIVPSGNTSGTYPLAYLWYSGAASCYLAYKDGSAYRIIAPLPGTTNTSRTASVPDGISLDSSISDLTTLATGSINSTTSKSNVYEAGKVLDQPGADYTTEIRLVRAQYTLHYNDSTTENKSEYHSPIAVKDLETPARTGYAFRGWYLHEDFSGDAETKTPDAFKGQVHYHAKWAKVYTVTFNPGENGKINGGTENISTAYHEGAALTAPITAPNRHFALGGLHAAGFRSNRICTAPRQKTLHRQVLPIIKPHSALFTAMK